MDDGLVMMSWAAHLVFNRCNSLDVRLNSWARNARPYGPTSEFPCL
jgi:hypothetical protein